MKRKELEDLGLTKEQIDAAMKINGNDIENAKSASVAEIENLQTEVESLQKQVSERDTQLETLKKSAGDNEELQQKIQQLQEENETAKASHESEMTQLKVNFAVEKALGNAKAKNIKAVKALLDLTDAKLDKEGNVKGLAEQIEKLTTGEDTKFLFDLQQNTFRGFQPGASSDTKPGAEVNLSQMSYEELTAYMESNPNIQV